MEQVERARSHAALGDVHRLRVIDRLAVGDHTFAELAGLIEMKGNLLAHHLEVLESAGLIERRVSEGDRRRRYISLRWEGLPSMPLAFFAPGDRVVFVCTHNSARSQFAAALWQQTTGTEAASAGSQPAARVHPLAVEVASEFDVDIRSGEPVGYDRLTFTPDLVVSVCDRARESGLPDARSYLHWSVPDPVRSGTLESFRSAFGEITRRVERLTGHTLGAS